MGTARLRVALWALVSLLVLSALVAIPGALAGSPTTYQISGSVEQPGPVPVPAGVAVDLESQASHNVYTVTTTGSGQYTFDQPHTANTLAAGYWGLFVPPQAKLHLAGCNPCAILPIHQNPTWVWENSTTLTPPTSPVTIGNVTAAPYDSWIFGNVTDLSTGKPVASASVELLAPFWNGFVLNNATTNKSGSFNFSAPSTGASPTGNWVLQTIEPGTPNKFNYSSIVGLTQSRVNLNVVVGNYYTDGWINLASNHAAHVPNGGNATVYDTSNGFLYTQGLPAGGFYSIGTYPAGFTSGNPQTFDVVLSTVGYGTTWYPLTVSGGSPHGIPIPHYSYVPAIAPPAVYATTLDFTKGYTNLSVSTAATLSNYSVFPELPNASVGQLWAQLGLNFQHSISFSSSGLGALWSWLNASGPFFPAGQGLVKVATSTPVASNTTFNESKTWTATHTSGCSGTCDLSSSGGLSLGWSESYTGFPKSLPVNQSTYTLSFVFRHPTHGQAFNYTVRLPPGYVLQSGATPPPQTTIVPVTPGIFTNFTLVSQPSPSAFGTATLNLVKFSGVKAIVNASAASFAFSVKNVVNSTRGNYSVIVGTGQNVSFTGQNSTFPAGTNGTLFQWNFGDGSPLQNRTTPTFWHTFAGAKEYTGSLKLTSSGGLTNTTVFHVYAGSSPPGAAISTNATAAQHNKTSGGATYLFVPWGTAINFNATNSSSTIFSGSTVPGVISVANFTLATAKNTWYHNYSRAGGGDPFSTWSAAFLGAGYYLTSGTVNGTSVTFTGWQYNLTLTVWDAEGHSAKTTLVILVKDTQKPTPVVNVASADGKAISSSGVTEGPNGSALVYFNATGSTDPGNGSITNYSWYLTNKGNASVHVWTNQSAGSGYKAPARFGKWLASQGKPYVMNLTVTDRAGNKNWHTVNFTIGINTTLRPVLVVGNLTTPTSMTDGSSYTIWVNVTNSLGKNSTAQNVSVQFYLLPPSGSGGRILIGGSPASVTFYNYYNGIVSTVANATGTTSLKYNQTTRAQISFNPARTGTFDLWANATASNEFVSNYASGANQVHVQVDLKQNPIQQYELYGGIAAAVVAVIAALVLLYRRGGIRRIRAGRGKDKTDKSGRKLARASDEDEEDEDET